MGAEGGGGKEEGGDKLTTQASNATAVLLQGHKLIYTKAEGDKYKLQVSKCTLVAVNTSLSVGAQPDDDSLIVDALITICNTRQIGRRCPKAVSCLFLSFRSLLFLVRRVRSQGKDTHPSIRSICCAPVSVQ